MKKSLALLVAGSVVFWLVVAYPARLVWGSPALIFSAAAGLLCLVPTAATLIWSHGVLKGAPEQQLLAVMGGTGVRLAFVIGAGMVLYHSFPSFHSQSFWIWVIVFYLFTLTLEMVLILTGSSATHRSQGR